LLGATRVQFNGVNAAFTVNSVNQITATVPAGATTGPIRITGPINVVTSDEPFFVCASNVTSGTQVTRGALQSAGYAGGLFGGANYRESVTVKNTGQSAIAGPISLVLDNLSPGVTLANRSGATACREPMGSPFVTVNPGSDTVLSPGETIIVTLYFSSSSSNISYTPRVIAGPGER
jgi:hypothetical protein